MSADRLHEAARVLRERAGAATPGPWEGYYDDNARPYWGVITLHTGDPVASHDCIGGYEGSHGFEGADAAYIATMHPGVGIAVAEWLDDAAANVDFMQAVIDAGRAENPNAALKRTKADDVADLILGAES